MLFRYDQLARFLRRLSGERRVTPLGEWDGAPAVLLRHDIDLDLGPARALARLERECGIRATFFVMTTCELYNVLAPSNRAALRAIAALEHEIGLHFDPTAYDDASDDELQTQVEREAAILASVSGRAVRSVSLHNPSMHGRFPMFEGFRNAYDPAIFAEDRYLSDSRRRFRSDPLDFIERAGERVIQLVLHPLHYTDAGDGYAEVLGRYVVERIDAVEAHFAGNDTCLAAITPGLRHVVHDRLAGEERGAG